MRSIQSLVRRPLALTAVAVTLAAIPYGYAVARAPHALADGLTVSTAGMSAVVGPSGGIDQLVFSDGRTWPMGGRSLVAEGTGLALPDACQPDGAAQATADGGAEWQTRCSDSAGNVTLLTEQLTPSASSIGWSVSALSAGGTFSKGIWTQLSGWQDTHTRRFWTTWGGSAATAPASGWSDPLQSAPFANRTLFYGGGAPSQEDGFSVPLATVMEPDTGHAVTLVQSPADPLITARLQTTAGGDVALGRFDDRLTPSTPVSFHMDLVPTVADWRPVLGWVTDHYPDYFTPVMAAADTTAGVGSYSPFPGPFSDTLRSKLAAEDYRTNWELSLRGPYIGEFMPPVETPTTPWAGPNFVTLDAQGPTWQPAGLTQTLQDWSRVLDYWESAGYEKLAYFNVQSFGWNITTSPVKPQYACDDPDRWRNSNDYLNCDFADAIVRDASGAPRYVYQHTAVLDPADPTYRQHLLDQAKALLTKLPQYQGIAIDSLAHLSYFNPNADDGISWDNGAPARSQFNSWKSLAPDLESEVHGLGKQVWGNPTPPAKRIDILKGIDGVFSEFDDGTGNMNMDGFLGLQRPVIGWLHPGPGLGTDPDAMVQRYLYMGVYPMGDAPENDHGIQTSPSTSPYYSDYGPMFSTLRGKKWIYTPDAVQVTSGQALANVFSVNGGLAVPVVHGGSDTHAALTLHGIREMSPGVDPSHAEYLLPGQTQWQPLTTHVTGDDVSLDVPLARGAAMVRFTSAQSDTDVQVAAGRPIALALSSSADSTGPGHPALLTATVTNRSARAVAQVAAELTAPDGWTATPSSALPAVLMPGQSASTRWIVSPALPAVGSVGEVKATVSYGQGADAGQIADTRRLIAGELVPQNTMTATASSEDPANPAQNLLDGNEATMWQSSEGTGVPQSVTLDLHGTYHLAALTYLPRQDGSMDGVITDYQISVSSDGSTFQPVANGSWNWDAGLHSAIFDASNVRYLRFEGLPVPACVAGPRSGAEINLVTAPAGWTPPPAPPPTPTPPPFAHVVPQSQMTASATSAQRGFPASNAIDGDACTYWHTRYSPVYDPMPQSITLDLGQTYRTTGLQYLPRQDGNPQGEITAYQISTSLDGNTFQVVADDSWDPTRLQKTAHWAATAARYVRLTAIYGFAPAARSNGLASAADLEVGYE